MSTLEDRLRRTDPRLRTALIHHARGEHQLTKEWLDRFIEGSPLDSNFLNASQTLNEIERARS